MIAYTANLQHGAGTDGVTNYSRQVSAMSDADLIGVQERTTGDTGWDASLAAAGFSQAVYRENDPSQGDGSAIWYNTSTVQKLNTFQHDLSEGAIGWDGSTNVDKSAVAAKVLISGKQFYFVVTHLAWSAGADSNGSTFSAIRVAQIQELLTWVDTFATDGDVLIVGDMNFAPNYPKNPSGLQIDLLLANYTDLWARGINDGSAIANWGDRNSDGTLDMPIDYLLSGTHDTRRRIDFGFLRKTAQTLSFIAIELPDVRTNCSGALTGTPAFCPDVEAAQRWGTPDDFGVRPSDHNWVKLTLGFQGARKKQIAMCV